MLPELIIFDCDGVLVDSESVASRLVAANLSRLGWAMDAQEAQRLFLGMSIIDMQPVIEAKLERVLDPGWRAELAGELVEALAVESTLIPGARAMLERVSMMGIDWRVASNSSDEELCVKFLATGLDDLMKSRAFAAARWGRPKPAPDVYLAAARDAGVAPARCLVIEDSPLGVTGAVAAGMLVYGFASHGASEDLKIAGAALVLRRLDELFAHLNLEAA
jgi:HAD superfamily hydrolase (TIGR01509 family)